MITIAEVRRLNDRATYHDTTPAAARFMKHFAVNNSPLNADDTRALMVIDDAIGNDEVGTLIPPMRDFPPHLLAMRAELLREYGSAQAYAIPGAGFVLTGESDCATRTVAVSKRGTVLFDERDADDAGLAAVSRSVESF